LQKPKGHQENIIIETIQPTQPDSNETEEKYFIPLDGKWIIHEDPILIGKNFQTLTNGKSGEEYSI